MSEASKQPNRLAREKSPYLLQHAANPVDWYPWGQEAFERARGENKLIFLSIGYSTCHWCHVMEEESFTHNGVARILNEFYVSIKVDREERPDVDQAYMEAVMAMTGSGGWPLSVFLTPDLQPFFGGTYFPPDDRHGRPGFVSVLLNIAKHWQSDEKKILGVSRELTEALRKHAASGASSERVQLDSKALDKASLELSGRFDSEHGGFGTAPKFPGSHVLSMLLAHAAGSGNARSLEMTEATLAAMARGGIYDHIGGGFHRYSTDERWHVPHFEKMLYDQALLARTYTEAFQLTRNPAYEKTARETLDYVLRVLTHPEGGFYSAEDADSARDASGPKTEGAFYVWSAAELKAALTPEEARFAEVFYGAEENGNVRHDPHGEFQGVNVLYQARPAEQAALYLEIPLKRAHELLISVRRKLFTVRELRPRPHLDDKILTDWNALMTASFALAGRVFLEPRYTEAARRSVEFILQKLKTPEGRLLHRWRDGEAAVDGFLDDYVFFLLALYELYETVFDVRYLEISRELLGWLKKLFQDEKEGGFFFTAQDGEKLFTRQKPGYDGALPSGNSMAVHVLARLGRLLRDIEVEALARETLEMLSGLIEAHPAGYPLALTGLDFLSGPSSEIVIAGERGDPLVEEWLAEAAALFSNRVVILLKPVSSGRRVDALIPGLPEPQNSQSAVYICRDFTCDQPVFTQEAFLQKLEKIKGKYPWTS